MYIKIGITQLFSWQAGFLKLFYEMCLLKLLAEGR
jgi:hypothetical protein